MEDVVQLEDVVQQTYDNYRKEWREANMFMMLTHTGRLYYVNLPTGRIKWWYDTPEKAYQCFLFPGVQEYVDVDVHGDGDTPYHFSSQGKKERIRGISEEKLRARMTKIFKEEAVMCQNKTYELYLNKDSGLKGVKGDPDCFKIILSDWTLGIVNRWSVSYRNILFPCADKSLGERDCRRCNVLYARTPERLIEYCKEFGCILPEDGILNRTINSSRKIHLYYPKQIAAKDKVVGKNEKICYFNGRLGNIDVFIKRVPINRTDLKEQIERVHEKFSKLESVAKLFLVESDENYHNLVLEKMDISLTAYIEKQTKITGDEETDNRLIQLQIIRGIAEALEELHLNLAFHRNLSPEHVLLNFVTPAVVVVKLCGLGLNQSFNTENNFRNDKYLATERYRQGRTLWTYLTMGKHNFTEHDLDHGYHVNYSAHKKEFPGLKMVEADLVKRLMDTNLNSSMNYERVTSHVIFWGANESISFLQGMSDRMTPIQANQLDQLGSNVFNGNWILEHETHFKNWFLKMQSPDKEQYEIAIPESWGKGDTMQSSYQTTSLSHLVRFIRNTASHPRYFYPAQNKDSLHRYIKSCYPNLVGVVWGYISRSGFPNWI